MLRFTTRLNWYLDECGHRDAHDNYQYRGKRPKLIHKPLNDAVHSYDGIQGYETRNGGCHVGYGAGED